MIHSGPCPAKIMLVGEAPGVDELREGKPFAGTSGQELLKMLSEAGIILDECYTTNVCAVRPPNNDAQNFFAKSKNQITHQHNEEFGKWVLPPVSEGIQRLRQEIKDCNPNLIIALGGTALWALTSGRCSSIVDWRGSVLPCTLVSNGPKVLPTYHPAAILRQWSWRIIAVQDLRRARKEAETREIYEPNYDFIISPSYKQVVDTIGDLLTKATNSKNKLVLASDIETKLYHIDCTGLAWSKTEAICIPFMGNSAHKHYWMQDEETEIRFLLYKLLTHPNVEVVGQNYLYDAQYIYKEDNYIPNFARDTMIAHHVCFPGLGTRVKKPDAAEESKEVKMGKTKSLAFLTSMYCDHYVFWKGELKEAAAEHDLHKKWEYNCKDCVNTFEVNEALQNVVAKMHMQEPHDFQQSMFWKLLKTMDKGVKVNYEHQQKLIVELRQAKKDTEEWLDYVIGHKVNFASPKQVADLFYRELGQRPIINKSTGGVTTNDEALQTLAEREFLLRPVVDKVSELRSIAVFLQTFLGERTGQWITSLVSEDGRLRCSYNPTGTTTFRLSSSTNAFGNGMNLQNIPSGDEK